MTESMHAKSPHHKDEEQKIQPAPWRHTMHHIYRRVFASRYSSILPSAILLWNAWFVHSTTIGLLSLGWFAVLISSAFGTRLKTTESFTRFFFGGSLLALLLISVISGGYYLGHVTHTLLSAAIVLATIISIGLTKTPLFSPEDTPSKRAPLGLVNRSLILGYFASYGLILIRLLERRTGDLVIHFWTIPGRLFWTLFLFQTIIVAILCLREARLRLPIFILHLFLQTSLAAIVYVHGYGFDPFLHEAAIHTLQETGTLLPKTPYYIGAYSFVAFLSWVTHLSAGTILRWLGPIAFATIPLLALHATPFFRAARDRGYAWLAAYLGLSLVPISMHLMTTPQGLVYVFALATILLSFETNARLRLLLQLPLVLMALFVHPFLSLSLAAYSGFEWLSTRSARSSKILRWLLVGGNVIVYPVLLLLVGYQQTKQWAFSLESPFSFFKLPATHEYYHPFTDVFFATGAWYTVLLWIIAAWAIAVTYRRRSSLFVPSVLFSGAHLVSFFLLLIIRPAGLLNNLNYLELVRRVLDMSWLFLLPVIIQALKEGAVSLKERRSLLLAITGFAVTLLLITTRLYGSYPIRTDYLYTRGFQRTSDDVSTVQHLSEMRGSYVVLGHQPLAAEAIRTHGFFAYANGEFVYAIPSAQTNGLSRRFETLITHPSVTVLENVRRDFGVDHVFVVIPSYWTGGAQAVAALKAEGLTPLLSSPRGQNTIFAYPSSSPSLAQ